MKVVHEFQKSLQEFTGTFNNAHLDDGPRSKMPGQNNNMSRTDDRRHVIAVGIIVGENVPIHT